MLRPYVCPKCFKPSQAPDAAGACPTCGYTSDLSDTLLGWGLAGVAITLLFIVLGTVWYLGYQGFFSR